MKHLFSNGGMETYNQGELINPILWKNQQQISPPSQLYKNRINLIHRITPTSTFLLYVGEWIVSQDFYNFHP